MISSVDWSLKLGAPGEIVEGLDDVEQCLAIILTTPRGSDPLRPTFAVDLAQYVDQPISRSLPAIVRDVSDAIARWEPRIKLISVSAAIAAGSDGSNLQVTVTWQLKLAGAQPQSTTVTIGAATRDA